MKASETERRKKMSATKWSQFEIFVADKVGCPRCRTRMNLYPPSHPAVDAYCPQCNAQVQVKHNIKSTRHTHASSARAFRRALRKYGARNMFYVIGTVENYEIHNLRTKVECRRFTRSYRPNSKSLARSTGVCTHKVKGKIQPRNFDTWSDVARVFDLMIDQRAVQVVF